MPDVEPEPFAHVLVYRPSVPPAVLFDAFGEPWPDWGDWVGDGSEFLNTPNADVSFGRVLELPETGRHAVGKRYGPWVAPDGFNPATLSVNFQASSVDETPLLFRVTIETTFSGAGSFSSNNTEEIPAAGWHTGNLTFGIITNPVLRPLFLAALADGNVVVYCDAVSADGTVQVAPFKVSWLSLMFSDPKRLPLRQRQRDDGLALRGAPSWRSGGTSRQASNRWRSYL